MGFDDVHTERCDCRPPREARILLGREGEELYSRHGLPMLLPPGAVELVYVATCPDYPGGCGWIEGTWRQLTAEPRRRGRTP